LLGGIAMFAFLYWVATGYLLWDFPLDTQQHIRLLRPDWPWWTLIFAPYLILTVTSELWPSRQDWHGARWFVSSLLVLAVILLLILWYTGQLPTMLTISAFVAAHVDFALLILLGLDLLFLIIAEVLVHAVRR